MPYPNDPQINVADDSLNTLSLEQLQELMSKLQEEATESQTKPAGEN